MVDLYEKKNRRKKIRRGPKLEGYACANFGYSSETDRTIGVNIRK